MAREIDPPKGGNNLQNPTPSYPKGTNIPNNPQLPTKKKKSTLQNVVEVLAGPPVVNLINKLKNKEPKSNIDQTPMATPPPKGGAGGGGGMDEDEALSSPTPRRGDPQAHRELKPLKQQKQAMDKPLEKMPIKGAQPIETSQPRTSPEKLAPTPTPKHKLSPKEVVTNMKLGINHMRQLNEQSREQ